MANLICLYDPARRHRQFEKRTEYLRHRVWYGVKARRFIRDDRKQRRGQPIDDYSQLTARRFIERIDCQCQRSLRVAGLRRSVFRVRITRRNACMDDDVGKAGRPQEARRAGRKRRQIRLT